MIASTSRRPSPIDLIRLLVPWLLSPVVTTKLEVDWVPSVSIASCAAIIVVTRNTDIEEARGLSRRKNGVEHRDSAPIREEVALHEMGVRLVAEIDMCRGIPCKSEIAAW